MNALQKRVSKLERPIGARGQLDFVIHLIEAGTMRVTSRLRLIPGGGVVRIYEDGKAMEARIAEREATE